jgi:hypothetical protein
MIESMELLGLKLSTMMAGFCGATVYMVAVPPIGALRMFASVGASMLCAVYLSPIISSLVNLQLRLEVGVAFLVGLCAMSVVPGFLRAIASASADPMGTYKQWKKK